MLRIEAEVYQINCLHVIDIKIMLYKAWCSILSDNISFTPTSKHVNENILIWLHDQKVILTSLAPIIQDLIGKSENNLITFFQAIPYWHTAGGLLITSVVGDKHIFKTHDT